jgi:RNA polymerase II subunit A small phosphatase-like protein
MSKYYELVIFTASLAEYAEPVVKRIDPKGLVDYMLFRESCSYYNGFFVKDLSILGRD